MSCSNQLPLIHGLGLRVLGFGLRCDSEWVGIRDQGLGIGD